MARTVSNWKNPADFPKSVSIWRGSCRNMPKFTYINVVQHLTKNERE